jgi:hypothetical protein
MAYSTEVTSEIEHGVTIWYALLIDQFGVTVLASSAGDRDVAVADLQEKMATLLRELPQLMAELR